MISQSSLQFTPMTLADIPDVAALEKVCFRTPWSKKALTDELSNNIAHYYVGKLDSTLVAYAGMWIMFDEAHITNVAVAPNYRRRGYALQLMHKMMQTAADLDALRMTLEVREHNYAAQALYEKCGFVLAGRRRRYYTDSGEDALILWNNNLPKTISQLLPDITQLQAKQN